MYEYDLSQRIERYFREAAPPGVASVYVYGSRAAGRAHRESDIDIGVLLNRVVYPDAAARFNLRLRFIADLMAELGTNDIDLVILNDVPPELGRQIVTRGVRVFRHDSEADHAYVRDIQLRAADLAPFLRRMRKIKLESLSG